MPQVYCLTIEWFGNIVYIYIFLIHDSRCNADKCSSHTKWQQQQKRRRKAKISTFISHQVQMSIFCLETWYAITIDWTYVYLVVSIN